MATFRDWLVATRIHTAALTIPAVLLGALAADETDPLLLVGLGVWALGFHAFGFLHNNLCDLPHDRRDPAKQHFPLVNGTILPRHAWEVWRQGTLFFLVLGLLLIATGNRIVWTWNGPGLGAILALGGALIFGVWYNQQAKRSLAAPFWISISFACLPLYGYFAGGGGGDQWLAAMLALFGFAMMLHQIGYQGYLKDLGVDPVNWLRELGSDVSEGADGRNHYVMSTRARAWGIASRSLALTVCTLIALSAHPSLPAVMVATALVIASAVVTAYLVEPLQATRSALVRAMSISEVATYELLVLVVSPWTGAAWTAALALGPVVWLLMWNRVLWGGWRIGPKV